MQKRVTYTVNILVCAIFLLGTALNVVAAEPKNPMVYVSEAKAKITEVSVQQLKSDLDAGKEIILLDVRDREEFVAGHLPDAVNVSRGLLEFDIYRAVPNKNANIVVYCLSDARSAMATSVLNEMGYVNVKNMAGGFRAWGLAGYPIYNRHGEFIMKAFGVRK